MKVSHTDKSLRVFVFHIRKNYCLKCMEKIAAFRSDADESWREIAQSVCQLKFTVKLKIQVLGCFQFNRSGQGRTKHRRTWREGTPACKDTFG